MTPHGARNYPLPALVIVSGPPGTGKTYLSQQMARQIGLPLISKDMLKESLYETLGWSDRAWSMRLGRACMVLLYQLAETLLTTGASCIIESNFTPDLAKSDLTALSERCLFKPIQVVCWTEPTVLVERLKQRVLTVERHPGHADDIDSPTLTPAHIQWRSEPIPMDGAVFEIDTTDFKTVDYDGLFAEIKRLIIP